MPGILIVEDEVAIALVLEELLKNMGYGVAGVVHSGEEAVVMAKELTPDLILMDIVLPGEMDGINAARKIGQDIPVVFLTGYSEDELIEKAKSVEPYGYILKPFQPNQIKAVIEIALYNHKMGNRLKETKEALETSVRERSTQLDKTSEQLKALLNATTDTAFLVDLEGTVIASNEISAKRFGREPDQFVGKCAYDLMPPALAEARRAKADKVIKSGKPTRFRDKRRGIVFDSTVYPVLDEDGKTVQLAVYGKDITHYQKALQTLKEREKELGVKARNLEDVNTALKVLLSQREGDKAEVSEKVVSNVKEQIVPCIEELKKGPLTSKQKATLALLESNLTNIISPFTHRITSGIFNLTPKEIRVANLITQDKSTREIAELMNVSKKAVEFHRNNIRAKLGIRNSKTNLRTYLMTL
jgi:PAS domain S-box-containing protein